jgi:hypothetical protein
MSFEAARAAAAKAGQANLHPAVGELLAALAAAQGEDQFLRVGADLYARKTPAEQGAVFAFAEAVPAGLEPVRGLLLKAAEKGMLEAAAHIDAQVKARLKEFDTSVAGVRAEAEALHRKQQELEKQAKRG